MTLWKSSSHRLLYNACKYNVDYYTLLRNLFVIVILIVAQSPSTFSGPPSTNYAKSPENKPQNQTILLFANRKDIRLLDPTLSRRSNTTILVRNLQLATAVDVNVQAGVICWSDTEVEKIECQYSGNNNEPAQRKSLVSVFSEDIVMDTLTFKLYWTDSINNRIEVICLKTHLRRVIIHQDMDQPRAITLDTAARLIFWSDWGEIPKIEKASMDGKNRKVIVDEDIFWPNGMALDEYNKKVYWVDAKLRYIASVDYNGQNRLLINEGGPLHPFSLAYYNQVLYWSDWHTNSLHSIRLDTKQIKMLTSTSKSNISPMDVVIYENRYNHNGVNPCEKSGCSHLCLLSSANPDPSRHFTCACPIGVKLINETHCNEGGIEEFLIVSRGQDIRRISLDTPDYTEVIIPFTGITHLVTLDYWNGSVFWTDDEIRKIQQGPLSEDFEFVSSPSSSSSTSNNKKSNNNNDNNKYRTTDIITTDIVHPDGLAIDWVAQNLYWNDAGTDRIEVSKLNGQFRKILISKGLVEPRGITIDPSEQYGYLFWSDWGKRARIERAKLDGSERTTIISTDIHWPNGIAVDSSQGKIYWCDAQTYKIESADYDGKNRRALIKESLPTHTFGFSLLGDYIYWTDWQRQTVERANKFTGEDRTIIKEQFTDPMGIVAVRPKGYNYTLNPCGWQRLECQHLCLYTGGKSSASDSGSSASKSKSNNATYYCACAAGYMLEKDNKSCSLPDAFILYSNNGEIHRLGLGQGQSGVHRSDILPVNGKSPSAIDYDATESRIYWTDVKTNSIFRAFINGFDTERVVDFGVVHPEGLAVDYLNRLIYWTDMGKNRIEVAKLNGNYRKTIIWDVEAPRAIIVQPSKGWLYWSSWSSSNPTIEKSALDGSQRSILVSGIGRAYGLALESDFVYWSDIDNYLIERVNLNNGQRMTILRNNDERHGMLNFRPFSISTYQSKIYMEDQESSAILVFNTIDKSLDKLYYPTYNNNNNNNNQQPHHKSTTIQIQELKIYDRMKQEEGPNYTPCRDHNCSHICFAIAHPNSKDKDKDLLTPTCGCQSHYNPSPDNPNGCDPPVQYLLFTGVNHISRYVESTFDSIVLGGLKKVSGVGIDRNFVYIVTNGILKRVKYPGDTSSDSSSSSSSNSNSGGGSSKSKSSGNGPSGLSFSSSSSSSSSSSLSNPNSNSAANGQQHVRDNVASFVVHGDVIFFSSFYSGGQPNSNPNSAGDDSEDEGQGQESDRDRDRGGGGQPIVKAGGVGQWSCVNVTTKDGTYIGHITCVTNDGFDSDHGHGHSSSDDQYLRSISAASPPLITNMKTYRDWLFYSVGHRIERVSLNGINRTIIANTTGVIGGFDIDLEEEMIFFSDTDMKKIYACDIHGKDRRELGTAGTGRLGAPTKIAVMKRFVYWVDNYGGIERMDKWTGNERSRVLPRNENLTSILHINTKETIKCDPDCVICLSGKASTSSTPSDARCTCPFGQILGPDLKSCYPRPLDCLPDEFQCKSGHIGCIHKRLVCNSRAECQDASDEAECSLTGSGAGSGSPSSRSSSSSASCPNPSDASCSTNISTSPSSPSSSSGEWSWILLPISLIILIGTCTLLIVKRRKKQQQQRLRGSDSTQSCQNRLTSLRHHNPSVGQAHSRGVGSSSHSHSYSRGGHSHGHGNGHGHGHGQHVPLALSSSFDFDYDFDVASVSASQSASQVQNPNYEASHGRRNLPSNILESQSHSQIQSQGHGHGQGPGQQGKSSSNSSSSNYHELLVPHPSPATTASRHGHGHCHGHHSSRHNNHSNSCCQRHGSQRGRHNKKYHQSQNGRGILLDDEDVTTTTPPPCPCSSICDTSDIYYGPFDMDGPPPSVTSSPRSILRMHHSYVPPPPSPT